MGLAGCGSSSEPLYEVTSGVVSGDNTQEIGVWAPDAEGRWPVVFGFHGLGGEKEGWAVLATELAKQGVVVFVPDRSTGSALDMKKDLVCANQCAASVAGDYGGDPDMSWTLVGHSLGASLVLYPKDEVMADTGGSSSRVSRVGRMPTPSWRWRGATTSPRRGTPAT
jgi:triacylglycerol esterase/lipase EstA (alpha/beta hydrolase family)